MSADGIQDQGTITRVENHLAYVEIVPHDACNSCGARVLCKPGQDGKQTLLASNPDQLPVGTQVVVRETGHLLLKVAVTQYGLPLAGFIIGLLIAILFRLSWTGIPAEVVQFGCGILGLMLFGFFARQLIEKLVAGSNGFQVYKLDL